VVAFLDNDRRKHGTRFLWRPVIAPDLITRYANERVFVASMYADQIYRQLTRDLGVDPERIVLVRREILEGAYRVSPWTYVLLGTVVLFVVSMFVLSILGTVGTHWSSTVP
jgi:hypothetical protein